MSHHTTDNQHWDIEVSPNASLFNLNFKEIWRYRDLLILFVRREILANYKQTILGPIWFFIQPVLTTLMFTVVFGNIAGLSTDGKPQMLFYLSGILLWTYFSDAVNNTSNTFSANASIFGKVYFPRIIMPLSRVISNLLKLCIQLLLFVVFYAYFFIKKEIGFDITVNFLLLPLLILIILFLGMGIGMIVSSLTNKYKDLNFLVGFGVQLLMYVSPVIYSLDTVKIKQPKYYNFIAYNPISPVIDTFRKSVLGGNVNYTMLLYSLTTSLIVLFLGMLIFSKTEKSFIDTV